MPPQMTEDLHEVSCARLLVEQVVASMHVGVSARVPYASLQDAVRAMPRTRPVRLRSSTRMQPARGGIVVQHALGSLDFYQDANEVRLSCRPCAARLP